MDWNNRITGIYNIYYNAAKNNTKVTQLQYQNLLDLLDSLVPYASFNPTFEHDLVRRLVGEAQEYSTEDTRLVDKIKQARTFSIKYPITANATEQLVHAIRSVVGAISDLNTRSDQEVSSTWPPEQLLIKAVYPPAAAAVPLFLQIEAGNL